MKTKTYVVEHVAGFSANTHFGREIAARLSHAGQPIRFSTLGEARKALREARKAHGGDQPGRFDIVEMFGGGRRSRHTWE